MVRFASTTVLASFFASDEVVTPSSAVTARPPAQCPLIVVLVAVLAALAPAAAGCGYSWRAELIRHASVEHNCPQERVTVGSDNGDEFRRVVRVEVCGEHRIYVHDGAGGMYVWREQPSEVQ